MDWKKLIIGTAVIGAATVVALPMAWAYLATSAGAVILGAQGAVLGAAGLSEWLLIKSASKGAPQRGVPTVDDKVVMCPVKMMPAKSEKGKHVPEIERSRNMPPRYVPKIKAYKRVRVAPNVRIHD